MSRPLPVVGGVSGPLQNNMASSSHKLPLADLLVTNLRLLDFHLRDDWPGITPKTLSTKDTQANQKQRIKCTEWILYRLFELWDADETRDKLQPFFPPLEPLQSLNLRAALFRCLNELKKNGVLGRETVLRKTMLDECKGEKLMEVLVVFSTIVVRKKDTSGASRGQQHTRSVSYKIATAPMLSAAQQGSLIPLSVAHAASLSNMLKKREEKRQRYTEFNELLDGKRQQLRQRVKASVQSKRRESNVNEEAQVKKVVQDSWSGQTKWPQALLSGDDTNTGDLPLQQPFHEIWPLVSEGEPLNGDPSNLGLLASLERRVHMQKERLQMWQEFHDNLRDDEHEDVRAAEKKLTSVTKFTFDRHQRLQLIPGRVVDEKSRTQISSHNDAYISLLDTLRADISNASKPRRTGGAGWTAKRDGAPEYNEHGIFSPVKGSTSAPEAVVETRPLRKLNILQDKPVLAAPPQEKPKVNGYKIQRLGRNGSSESDLHKSATTTAVVETKAPAVKPNDIDEKPIARPITPEMAATPIKITQPSPEYEEQTAADRIISSVVNATPSPAKQHLSLTERTRMSMAFFNGAQKAPDSVDSGIAMPGTASPDSNIGDDIDDTLPASNINITSNVQRRVSLLERTRLSMAAVPNPHPRKSLAPRQKRNSLFPVNQFETPGRPSRGPPSPRRDVTPTETLFSEDAEYASIFKSRPRIANSPVFMTPEDEEGSGLDMVGEVDDDDDDDESTTERMGMGFRTSPLAARGRMAAG